MHPSRAVPLILAIVLASQIAFVPSGAAGSAADPEVEDPTGDVDATCTGNLCAVGDEPAFTDVDLTAAWVTENDATFAFVVTSAGNVVSNTKTTLHFTLERDPGGTPNATDYAVALTGGQLDAGAPDGTSATLAGKTLTVTFQKVNLSAGPGNLLRDIHVDRERTQTNGLPVDQVDPLWKGTDRAPDQGTGRDFVLPTSGATPGVALNITAGAGAACSDASASCIATADPEATLRFTLRLENTGSDLDVYSLMATPGGPEVEALLGPASFTLAAGANATGNLTLHLHDAPVGNHSITVAVTSNNGASQAATATVEVTGGEAVYGVGSLEGYTIRFIDPPTDATAGKAISFTFEVTGPEEGTIHLVDLLWDTQGHPGTPTVDVYPRAETDVVFAAPPYTAEPVVTFNDAGSLYLRAHAEIEGVGHLITEEIVVEVAAAAPPAPREPILAGLGWLTSTAEAIGLDSLFGRFAELALLGLMVLLAILLVFLMIMLAQSPWVEVEVKPRQRTVKPGESAEFRVRVKNLKKTPRRADATFHATTPWKTGLQLTQKEGVSVEPLTQAGARRHIDLKPRKEQGDEYEGTLRVQVPADAAGQEGGLDLDLIPFDEDGEAVARRGSRVHVRIVAKGKKPKPEKPVAPQPARPAEAKGGWRGLFGRRGGATADAAPGAAGAAASAASAGAPGAAAGSSTATPGAQHPVRLVSVRHDPQAPEPGEKVATTAMLRNDNPQPTRLRVALLLNDQEVASQVIAAPANETVGTTLGWTAQAGENRVRVRIYAA